MKRSLYVASCALLASLFFTSCQKEDKNVVELTQELTAELQMITDLPSANARAARVSVLNKRFQDASARVLALSATSLRRGADDSDHEGESYAKALKDLAREVGRVRAGFPSLSHDGEVDRDKLVLFIGQAKGEKSAAKCKEIGLGYVHDETGGHEWDNRLNEYFGSDKLREALEYTAKVTTVSSFSSEDVPPVPEVAATPAADDDAAAGDTEAETDGDAAADSTPAGDAAEDATPSAASTSSAAADDDSDDEEEDEDEEEEDD